MGALDGLIFGIRTVVDALGVELPTSSRLKFLGATATYNTVTKTVEVTLAGGPPSGPASGDLGGSYPNPVVQNLSGNDPAGGELDATATQVQWFPNLGANTGKAATFSGQVYVKSTDDGQEPALTFDTLVNAQCRIDLVAVATQKGDGSGVGGLHTSWSASASYTRTSGAAVMLGEHISDPLVAGTGFAGPVFTTSGTNALVLVDPGGSTTGDVHWTVSYTITHLEDL